MTLTWTPDVDPTLGTAEPARVLVNLTPDVPGPQGLYIGPAFTASTTAPSSPAVGDVWLDTSGT